MADKKISELPSITGADVDDTNDTIAIVDSSTNTTKKITRSELFSSAPAISADAITGQTITSTEAEGVTNDGLLNLGDSGTAKGQVFYDFSAGDLSITNTWANSGADIIFSPGNSEAVRFTGDGNVGIGTSSPALQSGGTGLHINATSFSELKFTNSTTGTTSTDGTALLTSGLNFTINNRENGSLLFQTDNTERMRIDNTGNVLVGKTTSSATGGVELIPDVSGLGFGRVEIDSGLNGTANSVQFKYNGTLVGSIAQDTTSTAYNTSSDKRLKENIQDAGQSGDTIDEIRVVQHDWKADGSHVDFGFIAQELGAVYPHAVTVPEDPEEMQSVDYSKLVPLLVKEIQDLRKRVNDLEEK